MTMPTKPSHVALWIAEHGPPDTLRVIHRQTGDDTTETVVVLTVSHSKASTEVKPAAIGRSHADETILDIDHTSIVRLTKAGRRRVEAWKAWEASEANDLAEFERLKRKFTKP